jgi:hypothetical protein
MRENAKPHSADTMDFLQEHGIRTFDRPSLSPNFNITENLRDKLDTCSKAFKLTLDSK